MTSTPGRLLIGCIADDFTGATDVASGLVAEGLRTMLLLGVPDELVGSPLDNVDALVVALKSRTAPVDRAVAESVAAADWLRGHGCRQIYFKYCATFDSTPAGNIGPVMDALLTEIDTGLTVACPAYPVNGRTVYQGHLFVRQDRLDESAMRNHPLTPMKDSSVVRLLQAQTRFPVGLISKSTVDRGASAVRAELVRICESEQRAVVLDAVDDDDLSVLGEACIDLPLVTGAAGLARGLARQYRQELRVSRSQQQISAGRLPPTPQGGCAVIAGSASSTTRGQIETMRQTRPAFVVDPADIDAGRDVVSAALSWARPRLAEGPILVHAASAAPTGMSDTSARVEQTLADIAVGLVELGVTQLLVAGGETSGAVVTALGVPALMIGPEISPGVPWTSAVGTEVPLALALKSGGFGGPDLFLRAWDTAP